MNKNCKKLHRGQHGFTLIEIMVVVVILGILGVVVVPNFLDQPVKARQVKARQDIRAIESALELYKLDNFSYPSTDQGLEALVSPPSEGSGSWKSGGYLKKLPKDPWNRPYVYTASQDSFELSSLGKDGSSGGQGENSDITNTQE